MALGIIGLYRVIAYSVSQRTHEIGLRLALGAEPRPVYELILGVAGRLVLAGLVIWASALLCDQIRGPAPARVSHTRQRDRGNLWKRPRIWCS
jgi:FtsX-like permease family